MGKRSSVETSPALIVDNDDGESSLQGPTKRQKILCHTAALALLSLRVPQEKTLVLPAQTEEHKTSSNIVEDCSVSSASRAPSVAPSPQAPRPKKVFALKPKKPLTKPRLPKTIQRRRIPLPQGKPLFMTPKLAGHLELLTKPIDLSLR